MSSDSQSSEGKATMFWTQLLLSTVSIASIASDGQSKGNRIHMITNRGIQYVTTCFWKFGWSSFTFYQRSPLLRVLHFRWWAESHWFERALPIAGPSFRCIIFTWFASLKFYPNFSLACFLQIEEYNIDTEFYPSGIKNYRTFFRWQKPRVAEGVVLVAFNALVLQWWPLSRGTQSSELWYEPGPGDSPEGRTGQWIVQSLRSGLDVGFQSFCPLQGLLWPLLVALISISRVF